MRKRLKKKMIARVAEGLVDWYVDEFLPSIGMGKQAQASVGLGKRAKALRRKTK